MAWLKLFINALTLGKTSKYFSLILSFSRTEIKTSSMESIFASMSKLLINFNAHSYASSTYFPNESAILFRGTLSNILQYTL